MNKIFTYAFTKKLFLLGFVTLFSITNILAQAPVITYSSGTIIVAQGVPVSITPINSGGGIPINQYVKVTTFAGGATGLNGAAGLVNGTGTAALFNNPQQIAVDAKNNLYVADAGNNVIRKITPAGLVTTYAGSVKGAAGFADGMDTSARFNNPAGLAFDPYGNLLVADCNNAAIREITPEGMVSTYYQGFPGGFAPQAISVHPHDLLFISEPTQDKVTRITSNGPYIGGTMIVNTYISSADGAPTDVENDGLGNIYISDAGRNEIRKIELVVPNLLAGLYNATTFNLSGPGPTVTFSGPSGMQVMPDGTTYVADLKNNDIRKIMPDGTVSLLAGYVPLGANGWPTQQPGYVDGALSDAQFNQPCFISADNNGDLFVSERVNGGNRIRKIWKAGYKLSGPPLPAGLLFDNTSGTISGTPIGKITVAQTDTVVAINASGSSTTLINLTPGKSELQAPKISYGTTTIATGVPVTFVPKNSGGSVPATSYGKVTFFAGSPAEEGGYMAGEAQYARFFWPQTMEMDTAGNLYVADAGNNVIRKIYPDGSTGTFAGGRIAYEGFRDGSRENSYFNYPDGIVMDNSGNMYVADYNNNAIRKITPKGVVTTIYTASTTFGPGGMCLDKFGNLIVAAEDANQIWKITPGGIASVLTGSSAGYINGDIASAQFNIPTDVKIDTAGNLFVVDFLNNAIRKISPSGMVTTLAGSDVNNNAPGYRNGKGNAAMFNNPAGLFIAPGGTIYVADMYNNNIRRVMPDSTVDIVAGSAVQAPGDADGIGTSAGFFHPGYIFIDNGGTGYISEFDGGRIRKITLTGYSLSGTLPAGLSFDSTTGVISGTPIGPITKQIDTVTAFNAAGFSRTILTFSPSTVATLANLVPSSGTLNPAFASPIISYTDAVTYANSSITVTPTTTDSTATVTVNGMAVASGTASPSIPLAIGPNTITIVVTAQDGITTDTYTLTVTRLLSSDATLADLTLSSGTLSPAFAGATTSYTAGVSNATTSLNVTPTTNDNNATVTVNGIGVTSGTASAAIPLAVGPNTIITVVTAQDGTTTDTYTVVVTRAPSSVATLDNLTVNQGALSPAFASGTTSYTDAVSNATMSITVTPTFTDSTATITVNGTAVTSGTPSAAIPLAIGPNTITTVVTAQDGTTTDTYTVVVTRAPSSVATLDNLTVSQGTLSPAFTSGTTSYTDAVSNGTTSITVTPTFTDSTATIAVNGTAVTSGTPSAAIPLAIGPNTITTVVTAQDGTTVDTYTVVLTRAPSSDATLTNLTVSQGTLTPAFSSGTFAYTDSVPNSTASITVTPTTSDNSATIKVNGATVASGTASGSIPLAVGANTITTVVTAQDGATIDTYTVVVTRAPSSDATVTNLTVSEGTLTPAFNSGITAYTDTVSNLVSSLTVTTTTSDQNATVTVNGTMVANGSPSGAIPLTAGANTITVIITAQDGTTTNTYTITVYRGESMGSIDATNVLTPNGDGKNDYWLVKDIELYPQNNVKVFDKAGRLVYSKYGYNNEWDGTLNGRPLAEGTYYFVVDLGPNLRKFKGYVSILRN